MAEPAAVDHATLRAAYGDALKAALPRTAIALIKATLDAEFAGFESITRQLKQAVQQAQDDQSRISAEVTERCAPFNAEFQQATRELTEAADAQMNSTNSSRAQQAIQAKWAQDTAPARAILEERSRPFTEAAETALNQWRTAITELQATQTKAALSIAQPLGIDPDALPSLDVVEFEARIKNSPKPVVVHFWAPWSDPCKAITPVLAELEGLFDDKVAVMRVNVEQQPLIARKYGFQGVPTLLTFKDGRLSTDRYIDQMTVRQLHDLFSGLVADLSLQ